MRQVREIKIVGGIAYIPLTRGYEAIIDAEDVPLVSKYNWCVKPGKNTNYAARGVNKVGYWSIRLLHREVLGDSGNQIIDHINGNGLDNRKENLRHSSNAENSRNQGIRKNNTSGYKGIYWNKKNSKWCSKICVDGKQKYLGSFNTKEDAYAAYCIASEKFHKDFGRV